MAITKVPAIIRIRRGSYNQWVGIDPVLQEGELSYITSGNNANMIKIGDGFTVWSRLPFALSTANVPGGGTAGQILAKASNNDFDLEWINADGTGGSGGSGGGANGYVFEQGIPCGTLCVGDIVNVNDDSLFVGPYATGQWSLFAAYSASSSYEIILENQYMTRYDLNNNIIFNYNTN